MIKDKIIFKFSDFKVKIDINVYTGNHHFLLVMTGLGGDCIGFYSKYKKIAKNINKKHGCTVIVASTPELSWMHPIDNFKNIMEYINSYAQENNFNDYDVSIFGNSAGGTFATWYSYQYLQIKKLLIVNPVLNVNTHKFKEGLRNFSGESATLVFGELDQSTYYLPLLENINPLVETLILKDVDHIFKDKIELFIELPEKYLFG